MIKILSLIFLSFVIFGCGVNLSSINNETPNFLLALDANSKISVSEQSLALKICYSLKVKRIEFSTKLMGKTFDFQVTTKKCDRSQTTETVKPLLGPTSGPGVNKSDPLIFDSATAPTRFYKIVQTDTHGVLEKICLKVLGGGEPTLVSRTSNEVSELHFKTAKDGSIYFEKKFAGLDANGTITTVNKIDQFFVHPTNGRIIKIKSFSTCPGIPVPTDPNAEVILDEFVQSQNLGVP